MRFPLSYSALCFCLKDKVIPSIICFAAGSLMHISAVIAFLGIALYYLLKKCNNKVVICVTLLVALVFIFNRRLLADLAGMLFHTVYYSGYFDTETVTTRRIISKMVINSPLILLLLLNLKRERNVRFLSLVALVGIFLTTMGDATGRIGLNFSAAGIVAYGFALQKDVAFNAGRSLIRKEPLTVLFLLYCSAIFISIAKIDDLRLFLIFCHMKCMTYYFIHTFVLRCRNRNNRNSKQCFHLYSHR